MLTIDRFALALHCSAEPSRAEALARRLREVVVAALPQAAQRRLGGGAAPRPQPGGVGPTPPAEAATAGLVFIDRLELDAALASAWSDDRLALALAEALALALERLPPDEGATHGPGGSVRRYPDRAAWLAEYLVARAQGQAQGRWWFDALDGLASLPLSVALRTLIQTEGDDAVAALARLEPSSAQPVFQALNDADARRVAALWQQRPTGARVPLPALAAVAEPLAGAPLQHLLRAAVALQRDHPGTLDARTLQLLAALADGPPTTPASPATPADRSQAAAAFDRWLDADERAALAARRGMGAPHRQPAAHGSAKPAADGRSTRPAPARDAGQPLRFHSPHGGVLRLWVVMHWLRWPERLQRLLATALAGPGHGPSAGPRHTLHASPGQAMSPHTADPARQADGAASAATLARAALLHTAARALRSPLHGGRWPRHPPGPQEDAATLAVLRDPGLRALCLPDTTDPVPDLLDRHALALRWAWRGLLSAPDTAGAVAGQDPPPRGRHPRHARHARPADPARVLLAALADRVPGCAGASADYLRRNLLEGQASLVVDPVGGHADAHLDRPPLHVLLMLSGLSQARFALGGLTLRLRCDPDLSP